MALGAGEFMVGDVYQLPIESEIIDVALRIDVIDPLENFPLALSEANRILKPCGTLVVGTINRTWESKLLAICLGESLGFIPKGTHDFNLFVKPCELIQAANQLGLRFICIEGEWPNFWSTILNRAIDFRRAKSTRLAYTIKFIKPQTHQEGSV
jgi:2-polyprenyl-6-hydroxyphenyl methylase/3-demethylubiquinone-9 3-methyltransferase